MMYFWCSQENSFAYCLMAVLHQCWHWLPLEKTEAKTVMVYYKMVRKERLYPWLSFSMVATVCICACMLASLLVWSRSLWLQVNKLIRLCTHRLPVQGSGLPISEHKPKKDLCTDMPWKSQSGLSMQSLWRGSPGQYWSVQLRQWSNPSLPHLSHG